MGNNNTKIDDKSKINEKKGNLLINKTQIEERLYHNDKHAPYILPNDNKEIDRLDMQHYIIKYLYNENYYDDNKEFCKNKLILDIGCGTGIWCLEMATDFPEINIVGIDIQDNTMPKEIKPININFDKLNILDENLPLEKESFDYIHMQMMVFAIPKNKWNIIINKIIYLLKPNGYLHITDLDGTIYSVEDNNNPMIQLDNVFHKKAMDIIESSTPFDPKVPYRIKEILDLKEKDKIIEKIDYTFYSGPIGWGIKNEYFKNMFLENIKLAYQAIDKLLIKNMEINDDIFNSELNNMLSLCVEKKCVWNWHRFIYKKL